MEFYAFHGCYKEEQIVGNRFRVDLSFTIDVTQATESDSILDTVSYLTVYEIVKEQIAITSHILEHVSQRILDALKQQFPQILETTIKVTKLAPPLGGQLTGVSVEMTA